jgi:hypothetical protein
MARRSAHAELRNDVANHLGAGRSMFHRGSIEIPVRRLQSIGDAAVLDVAIDALRDAHREGSAGGDSRPLEHLRARESMQRMRCPHLDRARDVRA